MMPVGSIVHSRSRGFSGYLARTDGAVTEVAQHHRRADPALREIGISLVRVRMAT